MEVSGIDGLLSSLAPTRTTPAKRNDELDRTDFLNLLIAQLQNQDPLNPLESADFSAQLAQFSSLEQLMQINQKLTEDSDPANGTGALDALGFLGQEVAFASDEIVVADGTAPTFDVVLQGAADLKVEITQAGQAVASLQAGRLGSGRHTIDVSSLAGAPDLEDGTYQVRVVATDDGGTANDVSALFRARVDGVDLAGTTPVLLVGERRIEVADVREIRSPSGSAEDGASAPGEAEDENASGA
jgi:flagellar basal-body rod modification protein FlgD